MEKKWRKNGENKNTKDKNNNTSSFMDYNDKCIIAYGYWQFI